MSKPIEARPAAPRVQSEFYRHVILPSKGYKDRHQLSAKQVREAALTYNKQPPLDNVQIAKHRSSLQRQLSTDMLRQGYHRSFRQLCDIFAWEKADRRRLGTEHPLSQQPLLENEPDKLRFLCLYLTKTEEAERKGQYGDMYKSYAALASFFLKSEDHWLSDFFHRKGLSVAQTYSQLDSELAAQASLNVGLACERHGDLQQALQYFEQYRQAGKDYYDLRTDANLQLARLYMKLVARRPRDEALVHMNNAYEASKRSEDTKVENDICYKLSLLYLEHDDVDSALRYLQKYYEYCRQANDDEGFGQASEVIAICYQKKSDIASSTEYLTKYLQKASAKPADQQYVKACSALGLINTSMGRYESAIDSCSKAYSISLANRYPDLDRHRVLFGVARGLKLHESFNTHVEQMNIKTLLEWKCARFKDEFTRAKR